MAKEQVLPQDVEMAQSEPHQQLTYEQILASIEYLRYGDNNFLFNPYSFKCNHLIIVEILRNHRIFSALNKRVIEIPQIYVQKFKNTIKVVSDSKSKVVEVTIDRYTNQLTRES